MFNEDIMLQIAEMVDSGILVVCQNRIVYQNQTANALLNQFQHPLRAGDVFFTKDISIPKEKIRSWQRAMAAGELWNDNLEINLGAKKTVVEVKAKSTDGKYGKHGSYIFTLQDITEKESSSSNFLSHIMDNAPFMLVEWDEDGRICYVNKSLKRFIGLESEELVGRSFHEFMPDHVTKRINRHFKKLKKEGGYTISESRLLTEEKDRLAFWMNAQTTAKRGKDHFFTVGIDITDRNIEDNEHVILRKQCNVLAENLRHPLFILNRNLEVTFANDFAVQWFESKGYKKEKPNSGILFDLSAHPKAPEYRDAFKQNLQDLRSKIFFENNEIFERSFLPLIIDNEITSVIIEHRRVNGFRRELMLLDIEGEMPQSIIEMAKVCIVRLNEEMKITYANSEFASLLQYQPLELIGTYIPDIIVSEHREASIARFAEFKSGTASYYHEDAEIYRKDGNTIWVEVLISGVRSADGSFASLTATLNDITKRKKREAELKSQLIQSKKVKNNMDKFYSIIGHDLKNPFITTKLISENLLLHVEKQNDTKSAKYLKDITYLAEEGLNLLDNLVSWTKSVIEGFDYQPSYFSLRRLCSDVEKQLIITSQIKGITLANEVSEDIRIFADRNMLKTVIRNLVSNSIKYSHNGGVVTISAETKADTTVIAVSDNGTGIDASIIPHLLEINPKKPRNPESKTSTGIGLLICNHFVERHGGHISVESALGRGTTVSVELKN
ncbi:PAS domain S-box protein [uncultured Acetobacteroides sp.]|uniref:sensor histidine kinase n=1 Tax=uncultured Acetobacteroides sp. TaxID=1760811 RepID=UPI0029F4DC5F|nr:PAS domain S-box protein [uncultured Acetobacteroides sp.]